MVIPSFLIVFKEYIFQIRINYTNNFVIGFFLIVNNNFLGNLPQNLDWVCMGEEPDESYLIYQNDLIDQEFPWRHDGDKLAQVVIDLLEERTGPFVD